MRKINISLEVQSLRDVGQGDLFIPISELTFERGGQSSPLRKFMLLSGQAREDVSRGGGTEIKNFKYNVYCVQTGDVLYIPLQADVIKF